MADLRGGIAVLGKEHGMYPHVELFGKTVGTYGICLALAFLTVILLSVRKARTKEIPAADVILISAAGFGMGLLWGRFLYAASAYPPEAILERFWDGNAAFPDGGSIVFYGGLPGGILGAFLGALLARRSMAELEGVIVPYLPLGHAIDRIGHILAGHYGTLYTELGLLLDLAAFGYLLYRGKGKCHPYDLLFAYLGIYALIMLTMEFPGRKEGFGGISPAWWISLGLLILYGIRFLIRNGKKPPKGEK